jgi:hypothetical protein
MSRFDCSRRTQPANPRMQPTGRKGAGRRAGGALRECLKGSVGLCGRSPGLGVGVLRSRER